MARRSRRQARTSLDASVAWRSAVPRMAAQLFGVHALTPQEGNAVRYVVNDDGDVLDYKAP